jgi:predicted nucleotidyltransferase
MRPSEALNLHRERIREIALSHRVTNPRVFGSVLRGSDTEASDLDILVEPTRDTTLLDIGAIQFEISELLNIPIDVVTPRALPERFRHIVEQEAQPV